MKYLALVLALIACGKRGEDKDYFRLTEVEARIDSDGDGMADWDELHLRRDPLVADIDESLVAHGQRAELISRQGRVMPVTAQLTRPLRESLLREALLGKKENLPLTQQWRISLMAERSFWQEKLKGESFSKLRLWAGEKAYEFPLPPEFSGETLLPGKLPPERYHELYRKTYRLIISTPRAEEIYFISPQIRPQDFLRDRFRLSFDGDGWFIGLGDELQDPAHRQGFAYGPEALLWRRVGRWEDPFEAQPRAGETLALVAGKTREFHAAQSASLSFDEKRGWVQQHAFSYSTDLIVHFPKAPLLEWSDRDDMLIVNPSRERERSCPFTKRKLKGYLTTSLKDHLMILQSLKLHPLTSFTVDWWERGALGVTAKLRLVIPSSTLSFGLSSWYQSTLIRYGVVKTHCPRHKPLSSTFSPLWQNPRAFFYWHPIAEKR